MARVLEPQQVEIIGRHWLIGELVRAGLEAAEPVRDIGIDLLVSPADYSWTQPVQVKTHRDRDTNVYRRYAREDRLDRIPLLMAYTLLGDSQAPIPATPKACSSVITTFTHRVLLVLTPREAWATRPRPQRGTGGISSGSAGTWPAISSRWARRCSN